MRACVLTMFFLFQMALPSGARPVEDSARIAHLLNRITFGMRPGDIQYVQSIGINKFIGMQLNPASIPESPVLKSQLSNYPALLRDPVDLFREFKAIKNDTGQGNSGIHSADPGKDSVQRIGEYFHGIGQQYVEARLARAIESPRQLQEIMTDFWFNHFNVSINKDLDHIWVGPYERQAIRPYALGRFRDLLGATCHHPAMLFYLDNWQNTAPGSKAARGRFTGLNENYARELMELHTLGVDGGYTQKDVIELARILTGLGLPLPQASRNQVAYGTAYCFNPNRHDFTDKVLLGQVIHGSGEKEIEEALDLLSRAPATAHHISYQLAQYFVADNPPKKLVDRLASTFQKTDGDIKVVLSVLFASPEFWDDQYDGAKYKSPLRYVVSSIRAADLQPHDLQPLVAFLRMQGQPVYGCLTPDGYKNTQEAWLNPDSVMRRINFATATGTGKLPGANANPPNYLSLAGTVNGGILSPHTQEVIAKAPPQLKCPLLLGSPEFMHY